MIMHQDTDHSDFLEKHGTVTVPQPPCLPDLARADYFLFPKLKMRLKGRQFQVIEDIKKESLRDLRQFRNRHMRSASNHGRNVGRSALHVEGNILKGTMLYKL